MNIGEAARLSGVSAKMIRHYEGLGLVPGVARSDAGYRQYDEATVHTLGFIRRARDLGFGMKEIAALLALWRNKRRASAEVKRIALDHVQDLQRRIEAMQAMQRTLASLAERCHGDARPGCPILDDMEQLKHACRAAPPPLPTTRPGAGTSTAPGSRAPRSGRGSRDAPGRSPAA
jgi:MerR family copper efflux transcriptional regulator